MCRNSTRLYHSPNDPSFVFPLVLLLGIQLVKCYGLEWHQKNASFIGNYNPTLPSDPQLGQGKHKWIWIYEEIYVAAKN
jgi:hypothetical protein